MCICIYIYNVYTYVYMHIYICTCTCIHLVLFYVLLLGWQLSTVPLSAQTRGRELEATPCAPGSSEASCEDEGWQVLYWPTWHVSHPTVFEDLQQQAIADDTVGLTGRACGRACGRKNLKPHHSDASTKMKIPAMFGRPVLDLSSRSRADRLSCPHVVPLFL